MLCMCRHDLRKCALFVLSEIGVQRVRGGKYLFRVANVWWWCAQYFIISSSAQMPRDNRCVYMSHVCFMSVVVTLFVCLFCGFVPYR